MTEKKPNRAKDILQKYEQARSAKATIAQQMIELDKFDRGEQWQGDMAPWIPKPVTNYIHLIKTTQRANLALPNHSALLRPQFPEDQETVMDLQDALDGEWDRTGARYVVRSAIESALLLGTAVAHVYFDPNVIGGKKGKKYKGIIGVKEYDAANIFPDPNAYRLQDCNYIHTTENVSLNWIKNDPRFIEYVGKDVLKNLGSDQSRLTDSEIYSRTSLPDQVNGEMAVLHTHWEQFRKENGQFQLDVTYVACGTELYRIEDVKPSRYPFAILYDYPQRKSFWGMGTGRMILENQKIVNKVEQVASIIGTLMQNPQKEVVKESGINPAEVAAKGNLAGKVWVSNIPNGIRNIEPPQIPKDLFTLADQAKSNIREIAGMNEAYMGESVGSLTTSTGVNSLIERATIRDKDKMVEIELFVKDIVDLILQFMIEHYKEDRWVRMIGQDGSMVFKRFKGTDYKDLCFDIQIDVSGKMPTTRALLAQQARDLLNMQGQYQFNPPIITPEEVIGMMDIRDSEKIVSRMRVDKVNHVADVAAQVAQQMHDAMMQGVPMEQLQQMVPQMVDEMLNPQKTGSTGESGPVANGGSMDALTTDAMSSGR